MAGGIYALANQKGGVGKTTTAVNLAACLAEAGETTLVVDLDPQGNATSGLGIESPATSSYELLDGAPLDAVAAQTAFPNLFVAPATPDLAGAAVELARREAGEVYLRESMATATERFSFVFIDCPPSLDLLTVNALATADRVIVPVQCEYYALEGLQQLLQSIELLRARLNPSLTVAGILLTMVDRRTSLSQQVADEVRAAFGRLVFEATIPRNVRLAEAPSHGMPVIAYARSSPGALAYYDVASELVSRR